MVEPVFNPLVQSLVACVCDDACVELSAMSVGFGDYFSTCFAVDVFAGSGAVCGVISA